MRLLLSLALLATALAGCSQAPSSGTPSLDASGDGVVVVAILDWGINPYHWDFAARYMPQHQNADASDDLPLDAEPTWLPRFPGADAFASMTRLDLTLSPHDGAAMSQALHDADPAPWDALRTSRLGEIHYAYVPGTKIVGLIDFGGDPFSVDSHGLGSATVSTGNFHGTCPECLLVFIHGANDTIVDWVVQQDWIDVVSNSWHHLVVGTRCAPENPAAGACQRVDDGFHAGADIDVRRAGVERGQAVFWAAGNGLRNDYHVPMSTYTSDEKATDWTLRVGATSPEGYSYTGSFKPVDVAAIGADYPRGAGPNVAGEGKFSGTSNATPVTAGLYAKALYELRKRLGGNEQAQGVIASGHGGCGPGNLSCAAGDGAITVFELREALLRSANHTWQGNQYGSIAQLPPGTSRTELTYMSEGHGTVWGRYKGDAHWHGEVQRIVGFATGAWSSAPSPSLRDWFQVDSMCRQSLWGWWDHGHHRAGEALPPPSEAWPIRTALLTACPEGGPAVAQAVAVIEAAGDAAGPARQAWVARA